ncbi:MAG: hypothetical protein A2882_16350 [Phenylobacterium sp. RIFCSPHIGHO2_01_FULL_70_10]|nr:MAG: hypothetical protein A2882_16350 [Phenylobacterium sp. RIFCSPHIGHO2_01_FULL_70_10]
MPRIVDPNMAAHGDYLILKRRLNGTAFEVAVQRLFRDYDDALEAIPKEHGHDYYVVCVEGQFRAVTTHHEIVDQRTPRLCPPQP